MSSLLIVFTSSCPRVEAYATPYVMGRRLAAVKGLGTMPFTIRPRITDTTGSEALITATSIAKRVRVGGTDGGVFSDGISHIDRKVSRLRGNRDVIESPTETIFLQ